jgi:hypothetical protein
MVGAYSSSTGATTSAGSDAETASAASPASAAFAAAGGEGESSSPDAPAPTAATVTWANTDGTVAIGLAGDDSSSAGPTPTDAPTPATPMRPTNTTMLQPSTWLSSSSTTDPPPVFVRLPDGRVVAVSLPTLHIPGLQSRIAALCPPLHPQLQVLSFRGWPLRCGQAARRAVRECSALDPLVVDGTEEYVRPSLCQSVVVHVLNMYV